MTRAIRRREVISKKQTLTIACIWAFTALRMFFTFFFFVTSVICIVKSGSRIEKCKGQVNFSQETIDALDTTSTFIETTFSSLLIFLLYRWKWFHFKNFSQGSAKTAKCLVVGHLVDFAYCHERSHRYYPVC